MPSSTPTVFVSSTFYDLRQIRADLGSFIERDLGYRALLSENQSFPIDPDIDTIENCRRNVEQEADILVLIVGGRYGYVVLESAKSVTNLEYLTARAKGIPIYVFVDKSVIALLPVWQKNPEGDFSSVTDNVKLFDFIDQIRSRDRVWTQGFETAQDITAALKIQFGHLLGEGLKIRNLLRSHGELEGLSGLSGKAFRLALEKPAAWEYRLFSQVLIDEVDKCQDLRRSHRFGIYFGRGENIPDLEFMTWAMERADEIGALAMSFEKLFNEVFPEACGPNGQPGNARELIYVSRQIGLIYQEALEWVLRVRRARMADAWEPSREILSSFAEVFFGPIEKLGDQMLQRIDEVLLLPREDRPPIEMDVVIGRLRTDELLAAVLKGRQIILEGQESE